MKRSVFETILGAMVLVIAASFLFMAYKKNDSARVGSTYELTADFSSVSGLREGADIRIAGVKVGDVVKLDLDPKTYQATAHLALDNTVQVPDDSVVEIASEGLLGGNYVSIDVGGSDKMLQAGGRFQYTQAGMNLQQLIGQMIFSKGNNDGGNAQGNGQGNGQSGAAAPAAAQSAHP